MRMPRVPTLVRGVFAWTVLLLAVQATDAAAQDQTIGRFKLRLEWDPATGEDFSLASVSSSTPPDAAHLLWLCDQGRALVGFSVPERAVPHADTIAIGITRFDSHPADTVLLHRTSPGSPAFLLPAAFREEFTRRAREAGRVALRLWPATNGDEFDLVFDLDGSRAALGSLPCTRAPAPADPARVSLAPSGWRQARPGGAANRRATPPRPVRRSA